MNDIDKLIEEANKKWQHQRQQQFEQTMINHQKNFEAVNNIIQTADSNQLDNINNILKNNNDYNSAASSILDVYAPTEQLGFDFNDTSLDVKNTTPEFNPKEQAILPGSHIKEIERLQSIPRHELNMQDNAMLNMFEKEYGEDLDKIVRQSKNAHTVSPEVISEQLAFNESDMFHKPIENAFLTPEEIASAEQGTINFGSHNFNVNDADYLQALDNMENVQASIDEISNKSQNIIRAEEQKAQQASELLQRPYETLSEAEKNIVDDYVNDVKSRLNPEDIQEALKSGKPLTNYDEALNVESISGEQISFFDEEQILNRRNRATEEKIKQKQYSKLFNKADDNAKRHYGDKKRYLLQNKTYRKELKRLKKSGKTETEALEMLYRYDSQIMQAYKSTPKAQLRNEKYLSKKKLGYNQQHRVIQARMAANEYVPKKHIKQLEKHERKVLANTLQTKIPKPDIFAVGSAAYDFYEAKKDGKSTLEAGASAAFEFAKGEVLGIKGSLLLMGAQLLPKAAISGYTQVQSLNRSMNNMQRFTPFNDAQFADTQQLATMRQSGMEMAKMANYNLQQTLMGTEARYLHQ